MRSVPIQIIIPLFFWVSLMSGEPPASEDRAYIAFGLIQDDCPKVLLACIAIRKDVIPENALIEAELRSEFDGGVILERELYKPILPSHLFGRRYVEAGMTVKAGMPPGNEPNPFAEMGVGLGKLVKYVSEGRFFVAFFFKEGNERRRIGEVHFGVIGDPSATGCGPGFYILGRGIETDSAVFRVRQSP